MSNKILTTLLILLLPFTVSMGGKDTHKETYVEEGQKPAEEKRDKIQKLKDENLELLDYIVLKTDTITSPKQVKVPPTLLQEETIYVRVNGKVLEFKTKRDPQIKSFIIDIDCE